jgi:DNA mismatch repair protein MutL
LYKTFTQKHQAHFIESKSQLQHWDEIKPSVIGHDSLLEKNAEGENKWNSFNTDDKNNFLELGGISTTLSDDLIQIHHTFIIAQNQKGFIVIHQQNAHERILYERFANALKGKPIATQRSLFPSTIDLSPGDAVLVKELLDDLQSLGYLIEPFGSNTFVIQGSPADVLQGNEKVTIDKMLEQYKHFSNDLKFTKRERLLRSMAWQQSIKPGTFLSQKEMKVLADDLFNCEMPNSTPNGKPSYLEFKKNELEKMFGR